MAIEWSEKLAELEAYVDGVQAGESPELELHESDIADLLTEIRKEDEERYYAIVRALPAEMVGETFLELPDAYQDDLAREMSVDELVEAVNELETDDAVDMVQRIEEFDEAKAKAVLSSLEEEQKEHVQILNRYEEDEAGSFMQLELLSARVDETIGDAVERLRKMKVEDEVENIQYVFILDEENKLTASISLEELIIEDFTRPFSEIVEEYEDPLLVYSTDDIDYVAQIMERYNLPVVPVVDKFHHLLGRITSDDILDVIEESATEQIYSLANVHSEEELEDSVMETGKTRVYWLGINLVTAIVASMVIGQFEATIGQLVALAVLMPIVASMGGIAGTQTLTVVVRQMALGEVDGDNAREILKKEVAISLLNGAVFSLAATGLAWIWFGQPQLGAVMATAMFVNLLFAGAFGAGIPLFLQKVGVDPAVASGVLLTTVTDVTGFFTFLGLATLVLL